MERYIKEYADAKKKQILTNKVMTEERRIKAIGRINKALKMCEKEFITTDETILEILNCMEV